MKTLIPSAKEASIYVIDGSRAVTWPQMVDSINAFIPNSDWQGNSLDALDDILYGGYGTPDKFTVIWKASETSRKALGYEATKAYYQRLPNFEPLYEAGHLKTLFETLVEIFQSHDNIELRLE